MITTVLLDLDDTILADDAASDIAFKATVEHATAAGIDPDSLIAAVRAHSAQIWRQGPFPEWLDGLGTSEIEGLRARFEGEDPHWETMRAWGKTFRQQSWEQALNAVGVRDTALATELNARFEHERELTNPWCEGAEEALARLVETYRLGMVTNGISDVQRTKINATGIAPMFDAIVVSGELGVGKPKTDIYRHALGLMGATAAETIMVGDRFTSDVQGAQASDIRAVWISMGRPQPDGDAPWRTIESLAELPDLLSNL